MLNQDWLAEVASHRLPTPTNTKSAPALPISHRLLLNAGHGVPNEIGAGVKIRFVHDFKGKRGWRDVHVVRQGCSQHDRGPLHDGAKEKGVVSSADRERLRELW